MKQPIFVTGFGLITSIGNNVEENFQSLIKGKHGYGQLDILQTLHRDSIKACEIKISDAELHQMIGVEEGKSYTRVSTIGLVAAKEAIRYANISKEQLQNAALISATTTGGVREFESFYYELQDQTRRGDFEQFAVTANPGEHAERMADHLGIKKYISTISTACSSSANSLMSGANLIRNGVTDVAICGGVEALSKFTLNGFNSLMILDKEHCRPFDKTRNGLNLGEAAAFLVLESEESVRKSYKQPIGDLKGFGNANDAFHATASSPDGAGAYQAMHLALESGNIKPSDIQYINAHGTGTENNDLSEGLAIQRLFGESVPPFSSTKPFVGHTLAAAGAVEAIFSLLALKHGVIFPNLNFNEQIEELSISPIRNLKKSDGLKNILSNSFGFGGNTSSLLFSKV